VRDVDGAALMSWAVTVYLVPSILGGSCAAMLKQRVGTRNTLFMAGLVFLAGTLVASLAGSMTTILLGRALQGAGDGVIAALCYALIPALFPSALIARVFGVEAMVWAGSAFGGPLLSGLVTQWLGWRAAFLVNVPLIAGFLALVPLVAPREPPRTPGSAGTVPGARLAAIALGIMSVALANVLPGAAVKLACLSLAVVLLVWSVRRDRSSAMRLFPTTMFRLSSRIGSIYWIVLLMPLAQAVSGVYLVLALQRIWDFRPAAAGGIGALMALSWSGSALLVADRPGVRTRLTRLGPALNAVGLLGLLLALRSGSVTVVVLAQVVIGAGFGFCWATLSQVVMEAAEPAERDRATALLPTVQSAGYAIGAAVAGLAANGGGLPQALRTGAAVSAPISYAYGVSVVIAAAAALVPALASRIRSRRAGPLGSSS
jgi:MFS family permease